MRRGNNPLVSVFSLNIPRESNFLIRFLADVCVESDYKSLLAFYRLHFLLLACFAFLPPIFLCQAFTRPHSEGKASTNYPRVVIEIIGKESSTGR